MAGISADTTMDQLWYVQLFYRLFEKITDCLGGVLRKTHAERGIFAESPHL